MSLPEIDYVDLPNGRTITVCAAHQMVTCGRCCLDFSLDYSDDDDFLEAGDTDEDELFGFDGCSPVPRDVSAAQVAGSRYGRPAGSAPKPFKIAGIEDVDDDEDEDDDDLPSLVHDFVGFHVEAPPPPAFGLGEPEPLSGFIITEHPLPRAPEETKYSGSVFASKFGQRKKTPLSPQDLFPASTAVRACIPNKRFINRYDTSECLIYTDGACLDNGEADARGGCAFIFKPTCAHDQSGTVTFRLENRGPDGRVHRPTSNRAELRAVIAALRFRVWHGEGFKSVVIATDSTYVVNGATDWTRTWTKRGWRTSAGEPVKNRDLWEALLLDVEKLHDQGVEVRFWKIPRESNTAADRAAKSAASILQPADKFGDLFGMLV